MAFFARRTAQIAFNCIKQKSFKTNNVLVDAGGSFQKGFLYLQQQRLLSLTNR